METLTVDFASTQTLVRAVATALIVIAVTLGVDRLGPMIGGALIGLPIVIGPGFFFLLQGHGTDFTVGSATYALLSLCATQAFLLAYIAVAYRHSAGAALLAASASWIVTATVLSGAPASPALGAVLFVLATYAARLLGGAFRRPVDKRRSVGGALLLVGRGILAGILVAAVTAASARLGPNWAGILVAYPIGFTVVSVTLHQRLGRDAAIATLYSAMLGTTSLAAFSGSLAIALPLIGSAPAFLTALLLALAATSAVTTVQLRRSRSARYS